MPWFLSADSFRATRALLLACAGAASSLVAHPARAQALICCNIQIDVKGGWIGSGHNCAETLKALGEKQRALVCETLEKRKVDCPEVEPYCPLACDQAEIDRIKGRIRGLGEAARAHHKALNDSRLKRIDARDRLWGKGEGLKFEGGSISEFGQAALDSLLLAGGGATQVGKAYGKAKSAYGDMSGWATKGWNLGSDPGAIESWSEIGEELLKMQADATFKKRSQEAIRAMNDHFKKTGNYVGAQNVYRQRWSGYGRLKDFKETTGKVAKGLVTLAKLYEKTDNVANDLQKWLDAFKDNKAAEKEIAKIEDEIERLTRRRQRLEEACGQKPQASLPLLLAGPAPTDGAFFKVAASSTETAAARDAAMLRSATEALGRLRALRSGLQSADLGIGRLVFSSMSPWLAGTADQAQPRALLAHLVKESRGELAQFGKALDQLSVSGEGALKALRNIPPDTGR